MPKLRSFAALSPFANFNADPAFPWSQLTELSLKSHSSIPQFLEACTNLTTLHVSIELDSRYPEGSPFSTIHEGLQAFTVSFAQRDDRSDHKDIVAKVLNQLSFPNLVSYALTGFIDRSGNNLQILSLTDLYIFDTDLTAILQKVPSVVELTLGDCRLDKKNLPEDVEEDEAVNEEDSHSTVSSALLKSLHAFRRPDARSADPNPILPNLRRLYLHVFAEFDGDVFRETITSRWIPSEDYAEELGVKCLQKVELHLGDERYPVFDVSSILNQTFTLKSFRKQGMIVDIICSGHYLDVYH
ncbi:hypothetical protein BT96DRAFT_974479 [Gymnopus androsaceus JB14]|uniref:F-box domain-containing protein n=1 Tax=Gymnopus androsaceus JB14 TaxID=1447944 RepID=A0A6A4HVU0_9AGAR|nr:hypothetical protein BT96DRAFT_974479 [Gymnopus androsaceus JB14]